MRTTATLIMGAMIMARTAALAPMPNERTSLPVVYLIDYSADHVDNPAYIEKVKAAPPDILHVGHDVVFKSMFGPTRGSDPFVYQRLSPKECDAEMKRISRYVDSLHRAGAKVVIPYICDIFIFGDHLKRTGFWEFYDHWEEYARFGFGRKPSSDPITWMQNRKRRTARENGPYVYEPCINHPEWQRYLRAVTRTIARCGYDGLFVDVNSLYCYNEPCRALFAKYLRQHYSPQELKRLFGFSSEESVRLGRKGEGLLWAETQRFRAWSMARLFSMLAREGNRIKPGFIVLPNLSPMAHIDGVRGRIGDSKDVGRWAKTCRWLMYEEMQQSGRFGADTISDCILQYKFAFASGILGGMLLYHAHDRDGVALAMAEAGAGGGGCLIQGNYNCPEVRTQYRAFWRSNRKLFEGLRPWSQVGVCFLYDELYWGNLDHLRAVYHIRRHLSDEHVLFDFIVEQNFTLASLRRYRAVILPAVSHLSDERIKALRDYVRSGGILIVIGKCGDFDELGRPRPQDTFAAWQPAAAMKGKPAARSLGKGFLVQMSSLNEVVPSRAFELFDLSEDESNDIEVVMKRTQATPAEARKPSPLLSLLRSLAKTGFAVADPQAPPTVRVSAFAREGRSDALLVAHVLNYNVPIHAIGKSGPPVIARGLRLSLPIPEGWRVSAIDALEPGADRQSLAFSQHADRLDFTLPELAIYKVVGIHLSR